MVWGTAKRASLPTLRYRPPAPGVLQTVWCGGDPRFIVPWGKAGVRERRIASSCQGLLSCTACLGSAAWGGRQPQVSRPSRSALTHTVPEVPIKLLLRGVAVRHGHRRPNRREFGSRAMGPAEGAPPSVDYVEPLKGAGGCQPPSAGV